MGAGRDDERGHAEAGGAVHRGAVPVGDQRDELGRLWVDMEFVDSGSSTAVTVTAIGDRIAASALAGMADLVFSALSAFPG